MNKLQLVLLIVLLSIISTIFYLKTQTLKTKLSACEQQVQQLVDEKIAELHYTTDYTFGHQPYQKAFFDSLIQAYEVLRLALKEDQFTPEAQTYLNHFIVYGLAKPTKTPLTSFLENNDLSFLEDIYNLDVSQTANQLLTIINPYGFSNHVYYNSYDVWKVKETEEAIVYHLRLLKNHELRVVSLKIIPSPGIKVIGPNLVEIRQPIGRRDSLIHFRIYDWAKNDTIEEAFYPENAANL